MSKEYGLLSWKIVDLLLVTCFVLLAYANIIQMMFGGVFSYVDEAITILLSLTALASSRRSPSNNHVDRWIILCLLALCIVGIMGNLIHKFQASWLNVAVDILACSRFFIMYCFARRIAYDSQKVLRTCTAIAKFSLMLLTIFMVVSQFVDIGMSEGTRYGIRSYKFLFGHPTNFSAAVVGFISIILANNPKSRVYPLLAILLLCSSMRFKSIGFAFVLFAMTYLYGNTKRVPISFFLVAGLGAILLAYDQFDLYFGNEGSARSVLLNTSFDVANSYFPLGSGFATYGSNASAEPYLDFYYVLGFDKVYGLMPLEHSYLVDSFWPIVIGQFGYIGLALFLVILFIFIIGLFKEIAVKQYILWAILSVPIYLLISSTSEASFFSTYAAYLGLVMAIILPGNTSYKLVS